jgi:hypothetical protein
VEEFDSDCSNEYEDECEEGEGDEYSGNSSEEEAAATYRQQSRPNPQ